MPDTFLPELKLNESVFNINTTILLWIKHTYATDNGLHYVYVHYLFHL